MFMDIVACLRPSLVTHRWHCVVQHFRHRLVEFLDLTIPACTIREQPVNEHTYNAHMQHFTSGWGLLDIRLTTVEPWFTFTSGWGLLDIRLTKYCGTLIYLYQWLGPPRHQIDYCGTLVYLYQWLGPPRHQIDYSGTLVYFYQWLGPPRHQID